MSQDKPIKGIKPHKDLSNLRQSIGALDQDLLEIFAKRRQLSLEVAATKFAHDRVIRDQTQERHLLTNLTQKGLELGIDPNTTLSLFHNIIEDSVRTQHDYFMASSQSIEPSSVSVAVLGDPESYSHIAAQNYFSTKIQSLEAIHCSSFADIFNNVITGDADLGLVPIENTTSGNITEVYDLLIENQLHIIGEEKLKVKHCLVGIEGSDIAELKHVYSHPQAIAQCKDFFQENPEITSHYRNSSSGALGLIKQLNDPTSAAIASEMAAKKTGLSVLKFGINNYQENYTRFLMISKAPIKVPEKVPAKSTIIIRTEQKAGALLDCLQVLNNHQINLTKLESRPIPTTPWQEMFYLDFDGNVEDLEVDKALNELEGVASSVRLLGCYPKHDILATKLDTHALSD